MKKDKETAKRDENPDTPATQIELVCPMHKEEKVYSWFGLACPRCLNEQLDESSSPWL
jgi:hypothetical protein